MGIVMVKIHGFENLMNQTNNIIGTIPSAVPKPTMSIVFEMFDGIGKEYRATIEETTGDIIVYPYLDVDLQQNINAVVTYC